MSAILRASEATTAYDFELTPGTVLWAIINSLLFLLILTGNILTIIAVRACRRLRAIISNLFILSLAVSDVIVGLSLPYHMAFYVAPTALGHHKPTCLLRFFLIIYACCVSVFTLITIALDRYIAIVFPYQYCCYMSRRLAYFAIAFNWLMGAGIASIPMFFNQWSENCVCEFYVILPPWYVVGIITPGFMLIWCVMFLLYWRILREALRSTHSVTMYASNSNSDWKSVQIIVFIMGCFSVCWLPYFIVACDQVFNETSSTTAIYRSALSLAIANSCVNPLVYAWKNSNFRRAFQQMLRCQMPTSYADTVYSAEHTNKRNAQQCMCQSLGETPAIDEDGVPPIATISTIARASPVQEEATI